MATNYQVSPSIYIDLLDEKDPTVLYAIPSKPQEHLIDFYIQRYDEDDDTREILSPFNMARRHGSRLLKSGERVSDAVVRYRDMEYVWQVIGYNYFSGEIEYINAFKTLVGAHAHAGKVSEPTVILGMTVDQHTDWFIEPLVLEDTIKPK